MYCKKIYTYCFVVLTVLLFTGCSSKHKKPSAKPQNIKYEALLVGINDYAGEANDLAGIDNDIANMEQLFKKWGFNTKKMINQIDLEAKLQKYAKNLEKNDVFILYYSGHGSSTQDHSGDEEDGKDEQIVLSNGTTNRFIIDDQINLMLNQIKARKLVIFDSCYSGTALKRSTKTQQLFQRKFLTAPKSATDNSPQNSNVPNTPILGEYLYFAASKDNEESLASPNGSLFTNAFKQSVSIYKTPTDIQKQTLQLLQERFHPQINANPPIYLLLALSQFLKMQ